MADPPTYPGYDVLAKRATPSWDAPTRDAIAKRLATPQQPRFFTPDEWAAADAVCRRIIPQEGEPDAVCLVALLDAKLLHDHGDGFREADMPYMPPAWQLALAALDGQSRARHQQRFADLSAPEQDSLLQGMQDGALTDEHWQQIDAAAFFKRRILVDVPALFYSQPKAWNELGFGGPASPRGYVRLEGDRPDPWEAAEATSGRAGVAERENKHVV